MNNSFIISLYNLNLSGNTPLTRTEQYDATRVYDILNSARSRHVATGVRGGAVAPPPKFVLAPKKIFEVVSNIV